MDHVEALQQKATERYLLDELDPEVKDRWGIPALRWHWKWSEHELRMADHAARTFAAIIEAMGGTVRAR